MCPYTHHHHHHHCHHRRHHRQGPLLQLLESRPSRLWLHQWGEVISSSESSQTIIVITINDVISSTHHHKSYWTLTPFITNVSSMTGSLLLWRLCEHVSGGRQDFPCCAVLWVQICNHLNKWVNFLECLRESKNGSIYFNMQEGTDRVFLGTNIILWQILLVLSKVMCLICSLPAFSNIISTTVVVQPNISHLTNYQNKRHGYNHEK